ncbi:MAG: hypothetical protein CVU39_04645 [Chloroflexi bacterium HGW-Chloroflexi-10]|nr:MAG: hypothetical protein CVU39_04645 [Chloroflexi bacterium HGW-Chloroflexi-10]
MATTQRKRRSKPILSLDFDGVLHWYRNGWKGAAVIDDIPTPGAVEFVKNAQEYFKVVVYSSRSHQAGGIEAMQAWMEANGFPQVEFATHKPQAFLSIDDRAIQFEGEWMDPEALLNFKPWMKR